MGAVELKNEYIRVARAGALSYGGSQLWSPSAALRQCGCGPVAALDTALYLSRAHGGGEKLLSAVPAEGAIPLPAYNALLQRLSRSHFPVLPPFGINPTVLCLGLDRLFHEQRIPFSARVIPATGRIWGRIQAGLEEDSPSLLAIGQNFPRVWEKFRLSFYRRQPNGSYVPVSSAKAHFVAVTGMDGEWLRISSWGNEFYVNQTEFTRYVKEHSASLISGLIYCTKRA